jgi:GrpB-like predicted nucleotidyltransferase (UPF0157 family)
LIVIEEYNSRWEEDFKELRDLYLGIIGDGSDVNIEHVGSTSVRGLAAKPIIDIAVVVAADQVNFVIAQFESHGFENVGEMGIAGRWRLEDPKAAVPNHTYVVERNSPATINHMALKQALIEDIEIRNAYADLKKDLATKAIDRDDYTRGKTDFIVEILRRKDVSEQIITTIINQNL